jgi:hypothetical protein
MTIKIQQFDGTYKVLPKRDYDKNPLTPSEKETQDTVKEIFQKSMEEGGRGAALKKRIDKALAESDEHRRRYKELSAEIEQDRLERKKKSDTKAMWFLIFFPITFPCAFIYTIFLLIGLEFEDVKHKKEEKIRLEEGRQRLKALGYHDDEIITFNG